jgi:hypothetical protein
MVWTLRPVRSEMWPCNAADVTALIPVVAAHHHDS